MLQHFIISITDSLSLCECNSRQHSYFTTFERKSKYELISGHVSLLYVLAAVSQAALYNSFDSQLIFLRFRSISFCSNPCDLWFVRPANRTLLNVSRVRFVVKSNYCEFQRISNVFQFLMPAATVTKSFSKRLALSPGRNTTLKWSIQSPVTLRTLRKVLNAVDMLLLLIWDDF